MLRSAGIVLCTWYCGGSQCQDKGLLMSDLDHVRWSRCQAWDPLPASGSLTRLCQAKPWPKMTPWPRLGMWMRCRTPGRTSRTSLMVVKGWTCMSCCLTALGIRSTPCNTQGWAITLYHCGCKAVYAAYFICNAIRTHVSLDSDALMSP
jgi:hypothetical protein